ncbi:MAG: ATP-binding cassette domain-containing protein, partial [Candidatus Cloacimonetes bacterium]|nr:ATP-binding cassette domain-containing protein [Candidatus Cloacimonadota bacterium]
MKEVIAKIENMSKAFPTGEGDFWALKNINLEFLKGEFSGFVGPSGSGKTTLLNILGSLDTPSKGKVEVLGNKIQELNQRQA